MSDYISKAQAVAQTIAEIEALDIIEVCKALEQKIKNDYISQPSADVVEVVRCKDCIHNDQCKHRVVMWVEDPINTWHKDIDFCSYGERKEK